MNSREEAEYYKRIAQDMWDLADTVQRKASEYQKLYRTSIGQAALEE